jgi:hypothetical protein
LTGCSGETLTNLWTIVQFAPVRQGQYDWVELRGWYTQLLNQGLSGWYMADISESMNRVSFWFETQSALDAFRVSAQAIGVPVAALSLSLGTPPILLNRSIKPSNVR